VIDGKFYKNLSRRITKYCWIILLIFLVIATHSCDTKSAESTESTIFTKPEISITEKFVVINEERDSLSLKYLKEHYGIESENPVMEPKIIVIHWTAVDNFEGSYNSFKSPYLTSNRKDISKGGSVNVCAHFLVDLDGKIFQLLPLPYFARHVIGLNYYAFGIENVGGAKKELTEQQLESNEKLVRYLIEEYPDIKYVIGHNEYRLFEITPFFLEKDPDYRNTKIDPGEKFINALRGNLVDLYEKSRLESLDSILKNRGGKSEKTKGR
jgi:N-acetylmuramoyl-L-alanine amidase